MVLIALALVGCDGGYDYEYCETDLPYTDATGIRGHIETAHCQGDVPCNYARFLECPDEPGSCFTVPPGVTSADGVMCSELSGPPTYEVSCCEGAGADGIGTLSTCRCHVGGVCAYSEVAFQLCDDGTCQFYVREDPLSPSCMPSARSDAGVGGDR